MGGTVIKFSLDAAKVITGFVTAGSLIFYAGKFDQRLANVEATQKEMKEEMKELRKQPVMRERSKDYPPQTYKNETNQLDRQSPIRESFAQLKAAYGVHAGSNPVLLRDISHG